MSLGILYSLSKKKILLPPPFLSGLFSADHSSFLFWGSLLSMDRPSLFVSGLFSADHSSFLFCWHQ